MVHDSSLLCNLLYALQDGDGDAVIAEHDTKIFTFFLSIFLFVFLGFFQLLFKFLLSLFRIFPLHQNVMLSVEVGWAYIMSVVSVESEVVQQVKVVAPQRSVLNIVAVAVADVDGMWVLDFFPFVDVSQQLELLGLV